MNEGLAIIQSQIEMIEQKQRYTFLEGNDAVEAFVIIKDALKEIRLQLELLWREIEKN